MQLCHTRAATSVRFDDPNLVSAVGLVPVLALAEAAGLRGLAEEHLSVPTDKGANAGLKVASLVAGMVAGADSIDDMALLRHGGMGRLFTKVYAPSTLGSFLRAFTFGHVRQLDAVASRVLTALGSRAPLLSVPATEPAKEPDRLMLVDVDDTVIEVHGYAKQGASFGYTRVRGLNALLATVSTDSCAPVIVAQRLRKGSCGSPRGAARLVADALKTVKAMTRGPGGTASAPLLRADSAFYGRATIGAAIRAGADVSVTVRLNPKVKRTIAAIADDAWTAIEYPDAVFDEQTAAVGLPGRGRRDRLHRVRRPPGRRRARAAGGAPHPRPEPASASTGRTRCSTPGGSTPSSPPPTPTCSTPSPPTGPTAPTRSSSRSTPT